jgi:hypothetical protein
MDSWNSVISEISRRLPQLVTVDIDETGAVEVWSPEGSYVFPLGEMTEAAGDCSERAAVVYMLLSGIQDLVIEHLKTWWPSQGSQPFSDVVGNVVECGFECSENRDVWIKTPCSLFRTGICEEDDQI